MKLFTQKALQFLAGFFLGSIGVFLLLMAIMTFGIWVALDYDPYFLEIDSCLDAGGVWDETLKHCDKPPPGAILTPYACMEVGGVWTDGVCEGIQ